MGAQKYSMRGIVCEASVDINISNVKNIWMIGEDDRKP